MTKHRILNMALAAAVITGWMAMAAHMDAKKFEGDQRHEKSLSADFRFARAAREICGENASWRETNHRGEIVCLNKRGSTTKTTRVAAL